MLAHPQWLWALPLAGLLLFAPPRSTAHAAVALIHPDLGATDSAQQRVSSGRSVTILFFIAACLMLVSLAQPQWQGAPIAEKPLGREIVLLVDTSSSMSITDFKVQNQAVSRLDVLKTVAADFVRARDGDHFGLVVFGEQAATLAPPSFDQDLILGQLARLQIGIAGEATALGDALGLALKQVKTDARLRPVIIVFSDGDSTAGQMKVAEALAAAQALKVKIYSVAIGSDLFASANRPIPQNPDPSLRQLAEATAGKFYVAGDGGSLQAVIADIGRLAPSIPRPASRRVTVEWYWLPLLGAIGALWLAQVLRLRQGSSGTAL